MGKRKDIVCIEINLLWCKACMNELGRGDFYCSACGISNLKEKRNESIFVMWIYDVLKIIFVTSETAIVGQKGSLVCCVKQKFIIFNPRKYTFGIVHK